MPLFFLLAACASTDFDLEDRSRLCETSAPIGLDDTTVYGPTVSDYIAQAEVERTFLYEWDQNDVLADPLAVGVTLTDIDTSALTECVNNTGDWGKIESLADYHVRSVSGPVWFESDVVGRFLVEDSVAMFVVLVEATLPPEWVATAVERLEEEGADADPPPARVHGGFSWASGTLGGGTLGVHSGDEFEDDVMRNGHDTVLTQSDSAVPVE